MSLTNLDLRGEDKWGNSISRRMYRDGDGSLSVRVKDRGSMRGRMVPYRTFMVASMQYGYIIERTTT